MQTPLRWLVLALCVLGSATFASAQETGSISGYTFDATGTAVAGVTITVTGAQLPGARTVTTSDSGFFQVPDPAARQLHRQGVQGRRRRQPAHRDRRGRP